MSLENLVRINQLQPHATNPHEIARLLASARRNLTDAGNESISDETRVLDSLRKKRNQNDYSGDLIEPAAVRTCIEQAQSLLTVTRAWLKQHRPDLASK